MTTAKIKLVRGDNLPYITLTLKSGISGEVIDLSDPEISAQVFFRKTDTTDVLATIPLSKVDGGVNGQVMFNFPNGALDVPEGDYEGEIELDFGGLTQTVYEKLRFYVREDFA